MNPIAIDFAPHPPWAPASARRWQALLVLGAALCATSVWGALAWQRAEAAQRAQLAELAPADAAQDSGEITAHLSPAQARAVHEAVASLNVPWVPWLAALERHLPEGTTLTQLTWHTVAAEPSTATSALSTQVAPSLPVHAKLSLQARQVDDMVTFLNALKRDPLFARLNVSRQDLTPSTDGVWVQFALEGPLAAPAAVPTAPSTAPSVEASVMPSVMPSVALPPAAREARP